jgi:hypothetical protein
MGDVAQGRLHTFHAGDPRMSELQRLAAAARMKKKTMRYGLARGQATIEQALACHELRRQPIVDIVRLCLVNTNAKLDTRHPPGPRDSSVFARRLIVHLGIDPDRQLGHLGPVQRHTLIKAVREHPRYAISVRAARNRAA